MEFFIWESYHQTAVQCSVFWGTHSLHDMVSCTMNYIYICIYCVVAIQKFAWPWPEITTVTEITTATEIFEVVVERFVTHPWLNAVSCTMYYIYICIYRVVARPEIITETEITTAEIIKVAIVHFITHPDHTAKSL